MRLRLGRQNATSHPFAEQTVRVRAAAAAKMTQRCGRTGSGGRSPKWDWVAALSGWDRLTVSGRCLGGTDRGWAGRTRGWAAALWVRRTRAAALWVRPGLGGRSLSETGLSGRSMGETDWGWAAALWWDGPGLGSRSLGETGAGRPLYGWDGPGLGGRSRPLPGRRHADLLSGLALCM